MSIKGIEVIKAMMNLGSMVTINQTIDQDTAAIVVGDTHIALSTGSRILRHQGNFGGDERFVQSRVPVFAMDLVRRALLSLG